MLSFIQHSNVEAAAINLLKRLKVDIAPATVIEEFEKHPDYSSMLAVSDVLTALKIENTAFKANVEDLVDIQCPFLVTLDIDGGKFAVVNSMNDRQISFSDERTKKSKLSIADFKTHFGGVVLVAQPNEDSLKPPRLNTTFGTYATSLLTVGFLFVFFSLVYISGYFSNLTVEILLLSLFKTAGLVVSLLLLVQSVNSNNPLVQALCMGGRNTDCNAILSSKAAKVFEGLSWSEVGFFYFAGTWLLLLFAGASPTIITVLALLNFVSLPYTIYSVYYQARVAKKWCVLCCAIQILLWLEFVPFLFSAAHQHFYFNTIGVDALRKVAVFLLIPVLLWLTVRPLLLRFQQMHSLKEQLRQLKYNTGLFNQILATQPRFRQPDEDWSIVLGDSEASNVITMVTNPYCSPCATMHKQLDDLIEQNPEVQVRIIFTAENTETDRQTPVTRHLMALNALGDKSKTKDALHDWYEQRQKNFDAWAKTYPVELIETDYYRLDKQKAWCQMAEVMGTPTMFVNGFVLPRIYQLRDLKYMLQ